jgi:Flp pilus assembly protein TadG
MMITGLLLVIMLVCVALVIDIGHAMLVQRQLQAGVDAAALAGAQDLPVSADAEQTAHDFSPTPGSKNAVNTIDNATTTVDVRCITTIPGCNTRYSTSNALTVKASANVPTFFARIIGVDHLTVRAEATACYPCSVRPLDIMIVLDRTGSMCQPYHVVNGQKVCDELEDARNGVLSFISLMDPKLDRVGLAVLPPAIGPPAYHNGQCVAWSKKPHNEANCTQHDQVRNSDTPQNVCSTPDQNTFYFGYDAWAPYWQFDASTGYRGQDRAFYVVSSLTDDDVDNDPSDNYVTQDAQGNWDINQQSPLVQTVECIQAAGSTSYSMAIMEAEHELQIHGRPNVQDVIVFFTDGGANTVQDTAGGSIPEGWNDDSPWNMRPCGAGVQAADLLPANTAVYTIAYGLTDQETPSQRCQKPDSSGHQNLSGSAQKEDCQTWGCNPEAALKAIATSPPGSNDANFYSTPNSDELSQLFRRVAGDVLTNAARLVDDNNPNLLLQ